MFNASSLRFSPSVSQRLLRDGSRIRSSIAVPEFSDRAIVRLGECRHVRFAQPAQHDDSRPWESGSVPIEQAEHPKVLAARACHTYLEIPGHRTMHGFPHAAAGKAWGRGGCNGVEDGFDSSRDLLRATVKKTVYRDRTVRGSVVHNRPRHRCQSSGRLTLKLAVRPEVKRRPSSDAASNEASPSTRNRVHLRSKRPFSGRG